MKLALVWLLCVIYSGIVALEPSATCKYSDMHQPVLGTCDGPMDRVLAKRSNVASLNGNCSLNTVPYLNGTRVVCVDCIPGTSGADRFFGSRAASMLMHGGRQVRPEYCHRNAEGSVICSGPRFSAVSPSHVFCKMNEFCTSAGPPNLSWKRCIICHRQVRCTNIIAKIQRILYF